MRTSKTLLLLSLWLLSVEGIAQTVYEDWWQPNGRVSAMEVDEANGLLYLGGAFTRVGPPEPYGTVLSAATGIFDADFPNPDGPVYASFADSAGGFYIGGDFSSVGGVPRNNLARINADGSVHPWNPSPNGAVHCIDGHVNKIYVGGDFTTIGGLSRNRLARLDPFTGEADFLWDANVNDRVSSIAATNYGIYVAGDFTQVGDSLRPRLARVASAQGTVDDWKPEPNGSVNALCLAGGGTHLYVGGSFTVLADSMRSKIARLDIGVSPGPALTDWNPEVIGGSVNSIAIGVAGNYVYFGGTFTQVDGVSRQNLAAVSIASWHPLNSWDPQPDGPVTALMIHPMPGSIYFSGVFVSGLFEMIGGEERGQLALIDVSNGNAKPWNPNVGGVVNTITHPDTGQYVFVGGSFSSMNGVNRRSIAELDLSTKSVTSNSYDVYASTYFSFNADGPITDIELDNGYLYFSGSKFRLDTTDIFGIGRWQVGGQADTTFHPIIDFCDSSPLFAPSIVSMVISSSHIYVSSGHSYFRFEGTQGGECPSSGGNFQGGGARGSSVDYRVARISKLTGQIVPSWQVVTPAFVTCGGPPCFESAVDLELNGSTELIVSGFFELVSGAPIRNIADLYSVNGTPYGWAPDPDGGVLDYEYAGNGISWLGGEFQHVGTESRPYLAQVLGGGGSNPASWQPSPDGRVREIHVADNLVFVQGDFQNISGQPRSGVAAFERSLNPPLSDWSVDVTGSVRCFEDKDTLIFLGGGFTEVNGRSIRYFAVLSESATGATVPVKAFLQGPFDPNTGLMHDSLRANGLIPLTEPFSALGFDHVDQGGGETINAGLFNTLGNDAIVDWVLLQLRDATDPSVVVATQSALLQRDGDVVGLDGQSIPDFDVLAGSYHIAVLQRNHLGVMTAAPVMIGPNTGTVVDFTDPLTDTFGIDSRFQVGNVACLWSGDALRDGILKYTGADNDRDRILLAIGGVVPTQVVTGYLSEDLNMDGSAKYSGSGNDRDFLLQNIGGVIPTNTRTEQLP